MEFILFDETDIDLKDKKIIGIDEVGVGDYFGPLVSCSVFIPLENYDKVIELGVKDSKKLSDAKIRAIAPELKKLVRSFVYKLSPKGYNTMTKYNNANELKAFAHIKTANTVTQIMARYHLGKADFYFMDQFTNLDKTKEYFNKHLITNNFANLKPFKSPLLLAHKAEDKELSVAVASIIARDAFLEEMAVMNEKYNTVFPFGASNQVKEFAKEFFVKEENKKERYNLCKLSFNMEIE
ncbi:ribonuclease HIII [Mycoplasmopsis equigenitalium]|uniref:Ribonuclease n=1 Tax=Mycoplasmopsis equigenitalium TaxID=114883 RepID=A0ABY5J4V7_9BACT|nr:ribonuclease HIII [Mycoplasmopsis equigenitalium]UUD37000.1 ribonuclease HIII [Mycoplasmopsis equigenitalium]